MRCPPNATVTVLGWPDLAGEAVLRRGDITVLAVDVADEGAVVRPPAGARRRRGRGRRSRRASPAAVVASDLVLIEALAATPAEVLAVQGSRAAASVGVLQRGAGVAGRWAGAVASPTPMFATGRSSAPPTCACAVAGRHRAGAGRRCSRMIARDDSRRRGRPTRRTSLARSARSPTNCCAPAPCERRPTGTVPPGRPTGARPTAAVTSRMASRRSQITMSDAEVPAYLAEQKVLNVATIGPTGHPHVVAMWYEFVDGTLVFWTFAKSQKIVNLRRDPKMTGLVESGEAYNELRGVELVGQGRIIDDPDEVLEIGKAVGVKYSGPSALSDAALPFLEAQARKRLGVAFEIERRSSAGTTPSSAAATDAVRRRPRDLTPSGAACGSDHHEPLQSSAGTADVSWYEDWPRSEMGRWSGAAKRCDRRLDPAGSTASLHPS